MKSTRDSGVRMEAKPAWSVVVVYEDAATRERAVGFCDELVGRFWAGSELDMSWWSFSLLEQPQSAKEAAEKAAQAHLIVFSTTPEGDLPRSVKAWMETWLAQRGEREGLLAGLLGTTATPAGQEGRKHNYLRSAAHRGAMDYLTQIPDDISLTIPDSLDSYTSRAAEVTSLLDGILHQKMPPPNLAP